MAHISSQQNSSIDLVQVSRREALRLAIVFVWICALIVATHLGRRSDLHIPGHRTAFWVAPLLLGSWLTGRRREAGAVGLLGGALVGFYDPSVGCIKTAVALGLAGSFVGFCSAPTLRWTGLLKSLGIGVVCGLLALGAKLLSMRFGHFRIEVALFTYPAAGMAGAAAAWALLAGSKAAERLACAAKSARHP